MGLFRAPDYDTVVHRDVGANQSDLDDDEEPSVHEQLAAAHREIRRLRVRLNQIANAPRKSTVRDIKAMAADALGKRGNSNG